MLIDTYTPAAIVALCLIVTTAFFCRGTSRLALRERLKLARAIAVLSWLLVAAAVARALRRGN